MAFTDLQDNGFLYKVGDEYPRAGLVVSDERVTELSGSSNALGKPVIKKAEAKKNDRPRKTNGTNPKR